MTEQTTFDSKYLKPCYQCGKPVSKEAWKCPACGCTNPTQSFNKTWWILAAIGVILGLFIGLATW